MIDQEYTKIVLELLSIVKNARDQYLDNGLSLKFEDTFIRVVGLKKDDLVTIENNFIDQFLKKKDVQTGNTKSLVLEYLESFKSRLDRWQDSQTKTKRKRLERLLATSGSITVQDEQSIEESINNIRDQLIELKFESDKTGSLYKELSILQLLSSKTDVLIDSIDLDKMTEFGGILASILRAETINVEQRVSYLEKRAKALSIELLKLEDKEKMISTGFTTSIGGQISLVKTIEFLIYLVGELQYTCEECLFFETNRCSYAGTNTTTTASNSCNETWSLVNNDYWIASSDTVESAKSKLEV